MRAPEGIFLPLFLIERHFAEQLEMDPEFAALIVQVNGEEGVVWLYSFLRADRKKTYCLYEAPSVEAIRRAAERAGLPADVVVEVGRVSPEMFIE